MPSDAPAQLPDGRFCYYFREEHGWMRQFVLPMQVVSPSMLEADSSPRVKEMVLPRMPTVQSTIKEEARSEREN